jgi:alkylation response protein AidB-like acyl-CoA dehydrogenase
MNRDDEIARVAGQDLQVEHRLDRMVVDELLDLPLPGMGQTWERFRSLALIGTYDLALARMAEGHADAVSILATAESILPSGAGGVWAADPPNGRVTATRVDQGWRLRGVKRWCSGGPFLDWAMVTAHSPDGYRLFVTDLRNPGIHIDATTWNAVGMVASATVDVEFDDVVLPGSAAVGDPGWYVDRWGFWPGGIGVAACWYGGAQGLTDRLQARLHTSSDPHAFAELGAAASLCASMRAHLRSAANQLDRLDIPASLHPLYPEAAGTARLAWTVRASIESLTRQTLLHVERGLGPAAITRDERTARLLADLPVYLRQHHGGRDLEALGRVVAGL